MIMLDDLTCNIAEMEALPVKFFEEKRIKIALILISLLTIRTEVYAQHRIDSLLRLLEISSVKESLAIHLDLSIEYTEPEKGRYHAKMAYGIANDLGDSLAMVDAGRLLAFSYRDLNYLDSSIAVYKQVLPIAKRNNLMVDYGRLLNGFGITYALSAEYDKALRCHFESLEVMEKLDNKKRIAMSLFNIGFVYYKIREYRKALKYYSQALQIKRSIHDNFQIDLLFVNKGLAYIEIADYTLAEASIDTALSMCGSKCSDYIRMQAAYASGLIAFKIKKQQEGEEYFFKSYNLARAIGDSRLQFDNIVLLAEIYRDRNQLSKTEKYLKEAQELVPETLYRLEIIKLYKQFFLLYERTGDVKNMRIYQQRYIQLRDSVYNENFTNGLMRVQAEYLEREHQERLASQQQILILKDDVIVRQRWLNILGAAVIIFLIIGVFLLYKNNAQRKFANILLDRKIVERTKEQANNYIELGKKLDQNDVYIKRSILNVEDSLKSIRELISLKINEPYDSRTSNQKQRLYSIMSQLTEIVQGMQSQITNREKNN